MKRWLIAFLIAALTSLAPHESEGTECGITGPLIPVKTSYQKLAVSSTPVAFTLPTTGRPVVMAVAMVEDNSIRYRDDGTNPTTTVGLLVKPDVTIILCGSSIGSFRAIAAGADANISVLFYELGA